MFRYAARTTPLKHSQNTSSTTAAAAVTPTAATTSTAASPTSLWKKAFKHRDRAA